jgi:hypothetical protein
MSKAYKCNACNQYFDGSADTQVGHNKALERLLLGFKFSPENKEASFYVKDLCPACAELYCEIWKAGPMTWKPIVAGFKINLYGS